MTSTDRFTDIGGTNGRRGDDRGRWRNGGRDGGGPGRGDRVPPHNLPAEEAVLGAVLLSREALGSVIEAGLRPDDFYKPAHQHIYDVACAVFLQGGPADTITVAEELQRLGLLDAVGGAEVLHQLQNATPAISNAAHYAKIVQDAAMLRRLIMVAGDISELAYSGPDDVDHALDEAETRVFKVADRRITDTYAEIGELMKDAVERIEENYARGDTITGIATGYNDLDELLSGLQPSTLNIIGARPAMGKASAITELLATPDGWTTMGDVKPGDVLFDERGERCTVTYATPVQFGRACFEVRFDDGSVVVVDADHQWFAYDYPAWKSLRGRAYRATSPIPRNARLARDQSQRWREPRVVTTRQMIDEGVRHPSGRPNWYLPLANALELPDVDLPVDPYVLGCWLGDGTTASAQITIGPEDVDHVRREFENAGYPLRHSRRMTYLTTPDADAAAPGAEHPRWRSLAAELREVGLLGGAVKHIPESYLRASPKQRLALLQGIMDTDGHARPGQRLVELTLANRELLTQVHELVCSLGHKAHEIHERTLTLPDGRTTTVWRFTWCPRDPVFRMQRKLDALLPTDDGAHRQFTRRAIREIRPVPSVPVRCITVDSPNSLYLIGRTMIPTHNTAFGLGMATHIAKTSQQPVLVFSLEMGHIELTQRILSSEAEVDSTKIRNGRLSEADWARIGRAIGRLEVPLYLDDNPRVTVMEIRAKARRLRMQRGGLGLILVDYLQLMSGGGSAENRQLEISEISRNLKILARELEVPIVALSQLSRNLESRSDKKPMLSDLRESGCLTASTRLLRADNGAEITLGELIDTGARDVPVWSLDERLRLVPATLTHAFPSGRKPTFRVELASGRVVEATGNHRFRTIDGWVALGDLGEGSRVAVPRRLDAPETVTPMDDDEIVLLAHLLGDDCRSSEKVVPDAVFGLPTPQVALFLHHLWATDGSFSFSRSGPPVRLYYSSSSRRLIEDVRWLLLRLGIQARLCVVREYTGRPGYQLRIDGVDHQRRFLAEVGIHGRRGERVDEALAALADTTPNPNVDTIPFEVRPQITAALAEAGLTHRQLAAAIGEDYCGSYLLGSPRRPRSSSRERIGRIAAATESKALHDLATSDVLWDRITSIEPIGEQDVYDATVLGTHNFIGNGIVLHNSLEQDADVVMFLYRDEVYNKESPDRGAADLIIAKHRSGPIGDVRLVFRGQYARFDNAAPRSLS